MMEKLWNLRASKIPGKIRSGVLIGLAVLVGFSRFPALGGEDIEQARANYLGTNPVDFWGAISTLFYGSFPSIFGLNWQSSLIMSQIFITLTGLLIICARDNNSSKVKFGFFLAVSYLCLVFSSYGTRDGTLFSLLVLGISLISGDNKRQLRSLKSRTYLGILLLVLGLSFRPWVSICLVPALIYFLRQSSKKTSYWKHKTVILLSICLTIGPISLEILVNKSLNLIKSYPQQQVMIMDLASNYCWGTQQSSNIISRDALRTFTNDKSMDLSICQFFRADTWVSLTNNGKVSSYGLESDFELIAPNQGALYESVFQSWLKIILQDPVTYFQNKIIFATKVLIASDTRGIRLSEAISTHELIQGLILLPYDLVITFHLMSIGAVTLILLFLLSLNGTRSLAITKVGLLMCVLWLITTTIAYIGSNGRYTYSASLLAILFIFCSRELEYLDVREK